MDIIAFLMKNFWIVVIVIGLIYSMFFRQSPLEKRPPSRMPDFGGAPLFPQKPRRPGTPAGNPPVERRDTLPEHGKSLPAYREPTASAPADSLERTEPVVRPSVSVLERSAAETPARNRVSTAPAVAADDSDNSVSRDELTRAIIWSEILGPPRARRPFRR